MAILFFLGAALLAWLIFRDMTGTDVMPLSCASCHFGGDDDLGGSRRPWYVDEQGDHVHCRRCGARFREHPNGTLVEDRD
jgi:hypothetical protein